MPDKILQNKFNVPIQMTDLSIFDDAVSTMKERFVAKIKRLDAEITKFSSDLMHIYGQASTMQTGVTSSKRDTPQTSWDNITSSPLVEGDEDNKSLKLQFDVSQFDPNEVTVIVLNDTLVVSATHEEKTNNSMVFREYKREFLLPKGIDPQAIVSCLSKDGVLTVQASLPCQA
ncbi:heat shock protein beta-6-like [Galleria mellonella]|uniref:Heat shock protein beta-6-like n=1 Tax=Galleria mellonella TaxID=7137 RepID=A0A6J1WCA8_GALME|nr:heat shock protein beta-6-like [Galleria mellonella]